MYTNTGCKRLVDYYFVVSCSDHGKEQTKRRLCGQSVAPPHVKEAHHALFALKPKIVDRYPTRNYTDTPLLPWVARASMPRGVRARTIPPAPRYFTFTGWNIDGSKLFGACLEVFEKIDIKGQRQPVYIPKTLGFLSHYPYFYAFDVFLRCLWHVIPKKLIRLEDLLMHYFYDIPAPLPRKKIAYDLGKMKVLLACRNEFDVPIMELPIETPFTQLSKDRICMIIKLLLLERRIVFVCTLVHELTPVCELFASLLFPLRWRHLFIPLVCRPMAEALNTNQHHYRDRDDTDTEPDPDLENAEEATHYPHPFLIGLPRFVYVRPEISSKMPDNTFIVFLDRNEITDAKTQSISASSSVIPNLPSPLEENLRDSIHALARVLTMPDGTVSRDVILQAFRTMFAVITKLLFITNNTTEEDMNANPNGFVSLFKQTNLFQSFKKYYNRINPSDPSLKSIYAFFKQNEALGKHFARRSQANSWSAGFDQSQYSRDAFRVNQDVIKRVEKQFAKKRADLAASTRNTKFSLPAEFEHLPSVKQFLQNHVFYGSHHSPNKSDARNGNGVQGRKLTTRKSNKSQKKLSNKSHKNLANGKVKLSKKKSVKGPKGLHKKKSMKRSDKSMRGKPPSQPSDANTPSKPANDTKGSESTKQNGKLTKIKVTPATPDADDVIDDEMGIDINKQLGKGRKSENERGADTEDDGDEEGSDEDEDDSEEDSDEDTDEDDDTDDDEDDDDDDDEDEEDSEDDSGWDSPPDVDDDETQAAVVRHNRRFQNLNEFELTPKEKQWFVYCQKQHNSLVANIPEIKPMIAADLFDDNILKSWKSFQKQKMHGRYKRKQ